MSRINELKKQNPFLTIDGIEIINDFVGKSKYTEMLVNLIKNDRMKEHDNNNRRNDYVYELREFGYDEEVLKNMDTAELMKLTLFMGHFIGYNNYRMFKEFIDLKNVIGSLKKFPNVFECFPHGHLRPNLRLLFISPTFSLGKQLTLHCNTTWNARVYGAWKNISIDQPKDLELIEIDNICVVVIYLPWNFYLEWKKRWTPQQWVWRSLFGKINI